MSMIVSFKSHLPRSKVLTRTRQIFRSLILHPEREKWAVLNEIGEVPEIARLVETVVLIRIADILCLRPAEFEEQLVGNRLNQP